MVMGPDEIAHGALFLGVILSTVLYGIMVVQTLMYYTSFKKDPTWRKCLVGFIFMLETVNTVIDITFTHRALILHFGDAQNHQNNHLFITCSVILTAIVAFAVQLFFAWRIRVLTSSKLLTTAIVVCALASFCSGIVTAMFTTRLRQFVMFLSFTDYQNFKSSMLAWFITDSVTNVMVSVTLVWHLESNKTGFQDIDNVIDKIIRLTVPTGMITTIFAATYIVLFSVDIHRRPALLFYFPLSKLYTNSMLSSLNSRGRWNHVRSKSDQKDGSETGRTLKIKEGPCAHPEEHQDSVDPMDHKRAEIFVSVESLKFG